MDTHENVPFSVCWLGNAGWRLQIRELNILIDPDLEPNVERKTLNGIPKDCIATADLVLTTHDHGDHCNEWTLARLKEESHCHFLLSASCLSKAFALGIPRERITVAYHDNVILPFGEKYIRITPKPALHGAPHGSVYKHASRLDCGYLLEAYGITLYHPGDTVLLEEHFELPQVDVLMVSPTEHNTNVRQSIELIKQLQPKYIFPQHRDTYFETPENAFWTHGYHKELLQALDAKYASRYHILEQGQEFQIR